MELKRCSVSSSNSSSSSSTSPSSSVSFSSADRMVRIELEAAEALADLAHLAMIENGSGDSGGKWGSKGKRGKKRVKSESPPADWVSNTLVDSVPICPDLAPQDPASQDPASPGKQHGESVCRNIVDSTKVEHDEDLSKPSPSCVKSHPSFGGSRPRQNLTEAEKEARRLRRILANRESARQTIRRRQALCEELTKKAADLSGENETLKMEKELAMKEYQSFESRNKKLKAQMAKVKTEVKEAPGRPKLAHVDMPTTTATNCSVLLYNQHPFPSLCWPSVVQSGSSVRPHHGPQNAILIRSSYPVHSDHGPQNTVAIPSISMPTNGDLDSSQQQQENPMIINGPRTPLYIVSCPWFYSVLDHGNGIQPQSSTGLPRLQDGNSVDNQCSSSSSSKAVALMENQLSSLPKKVKPEIARSTEGRVINDLNETPVGFPPDGGGHCAGPHLDETNVTPAPLTSVIPTVAVKNENGPPVEFASHTNGICTKPSQLISALSGNIRDPLKLPGKKLVDVAAAAEARKRRKELTKLKNLHSRQCRMNC